MTTIYTSEIASFYQEQTEFLSHWIAAVEFSCNCKIIAVINIQFQITFNYFMQYML
jgi:hypothetical protein